MTPRDKTLQREAQRTYPSSDAIACTTAVPAPDPSCMTLACIPTSLSHLIIKETEPLYLSLTNTATSPGRPIPTKHAGSNTTPGTRSSGATVPCPTKAAVSTPEQAGVKV